MDRQQLLSYVAEQIQKGKTWVALKFTSPPPGGFPRGRLHGKDANGAEIRIYRPSQLLIWAEKQDKRSLRQAMKADANA